MQPDDARRADARAWLAKSGTDLRGMAIDLAAEPPLLEDANTASTRDLENRAERGRTDPSGGRFSMPRPTGRSPDEQLAAGDAWR